MPTEQKFCPYCGLELVLPSEYPEPIPMCQKCNYLGRNAPHPVVLTLVYRDDEVLLGRSPRFAPGAYALLAGHVELDETAEAAAEREVLEESGVACVVTHYMGSFPLTSRGQLCMTYAARYVGGEAAPADDVEEVRWFRLSDDLPVYGKIAQQVIERFRSGKGAKMGEKA